MSERTRIYKFNPQDHKRPSNYFNINDHTDLLVEILRRLDGRSLCAAASVCRLWHTLASADSIWEHLCFRHFSTTPPPTASPSVRHVVSALGGYRRLYMLCVRPVLARLHSFRCRTRHSSSSSIRQVGHLQVQLSVSLFCIDYYERLCLDAATASASASSSLMFLQKPLKRSLIAN